MQLCTPETHWILFPQPRATMGNAGDCRLTIVSIQRNELDCSKLNSMTASSTHKLASIFTSSHVQLTGLGWRAVVLTACDFPRLPVMWSCELYVWKPHTQRMGLDTRLQYCYS